MTVSTKKNVVNVSLSVNLSLASPTTAVECNVR